jgi:hypothetical protein
MIVTEKEVVSEAANPKIAVDGLVAPGAARPLLASMPMMLPAPSRQAHGL